mgnify:CR=1 FL=1
MVNIVDGDKLAELLTSFSLHNYEREQEEILSHFKDLEPTKKRTPHDLSYYTAAPSVQRRGVSQKSPTPVFSATKSPGAVTKPHGAATKLLKAVTADCPSRGTGTTSHKTEEHSGQYVTHDENDDNDICDDLNLRFDDLPLAEERQQGGESDDEPFVFWPALRWQARRDRPSTGTSSSS